MAVLTASVFITACLRQTVPEGAETAIVADGKTDVTAAIQKALDVAGQKGGGTVFLPKGRYLVAGSLVIPEGVCLKGEWEAPHFPDMKVGTMILATGHKGDENGPPLITLSQNATVKGLTVYYPEQDFPDAKPYPWTIQGKPASSISHMNVLDVTLVNPWKAIDFGTHPHGLHHIRNVYGCPLRLGIYVDQCYDIGRIENVHFNPNSWGSCGYDQKFPGRTRQELHAYLEKNLTGFRMKRTDWEYMVNCFVIMAKIGFHFSEGPNGGPNVLLTQCGSDVGPLAVLVEGAMPHAGVAFSNCQIMGTVRIGPKNLGPVKFSNCGFWSVPDKTGAQVVQEGVGTVILQGCHFTDWNTDGSGAPCVDVRRGVALIQASEFIQEKGVQVRVGPEADGVSVTGCSLRGGRRIEVDPRVLKRVQQVGNIEVFREPGETVKLPRLRPGLVPAQVRTALGNAPLKGVQSAGVPMADVRMAMAGGDLVLWFYLHEPQPVRSRNFWEGTCFELYTASTPEAPVHQLVFLPAVGDESAQWMLYRKGEKLEAPAGLRWETVGPGDGKGVEIVALIPLEALGLGPQTESFLCEIAATVGDRSEQTGFRRDTLFRSVYAHRDATGFGRMQLK